jgi:predicted GNAT family N-acyltransferase
MHQAVQIAKTQEELCMIYILRYAVYIEEMGFQYESADHAKRMLYDDLDSTAIQFYLTNEANDEAIGVYRLNSIDPGNVSEELERRFNFSAFSSLGLNISLSSKLMIHPKYRSLCTMQHILRKVFEVGIQNNQMLNFLDCSPPLVPMYVRLGYRRYTNNFVDPILGEKVPLVLFVKDLEYLSKLKSPLHKFCVEYNVTPENYDKWFSFKNNTIEYA